MDFDKEKVWQWIDEYWTASRDCPICASNDWLLLEKVWELGGFRAQQFFCISANYYLLVRTKVDY